MNENVVNPAGQFPRSQTKELALDFKRLYSLYVIHWRWFIISIISFLFLGVVYLWYVHPQITVTGKMEIVDKSKKNSGVSAGMAMLNNLPMGLGNSLGGSLSSSLGIDAEKEILKSSSLVRNVVNDLGLHTEYYISNWGRSRLVYKEQPVNVTIDESHLNWMDVELPLNYHQIKLVIKKTGNRYLVETTLKENRTKISLPDQVFESLPATFKTDAGILTITENKLLSAKVKEEYADGYTLKVFIYPPLAVANSYISQLRTEPPSKKVNNILDITLRDKSAIRAIDFISRLVDAYNERANAEKNEEARKTDEFVNERLLKIDTELGSSDAAWEEYKKKFQITDPKVDAQEVLTKKSMYETQLVKLGTQLQLQDYLSEYVNNPANLYEIIPISIGTGTTGGNDGQASVLDVSAIARHNSLVSNRKELLKSMSDKAPQVQRITETIEELHPDIITAMARNRQSILIQKQSVQREYEHYMGKIGSTPQQERALTEIGRQREIKQGVYLVMLQKREETAMELANVADKGKMIDVIQKDKNSNTPKLLSVLLVCLFLGVASPCVILFFICLLYSKVQTTKDIEAIAKNPIIGEIPLSNNEDSVRKLRTNLLKEVKRGDKVILFSSPSCGNGKSSLIKSLKDHFEVIGKKVVVLDFNLSETNRTIGYYFPSLGKLHPSDVIACDEFSQLLNDLKEENDLIILDSPSLEESEDAYQLAASADITCLVVRADFTKKSELESVIKKAHLPNINIILNEIDMSKRKNKFYYKYLLECFFVILLFASCGSTEKIVYLDNAKQVNWETTKVLFDARIMPKDILSITVSTINPEAAKPFNLIVPTVVAGEITTTTTQPIMQSYLVNNDGTIDYPIIGVIKVGGLTKIECEALIREKIRPYLADSEKPIVTVRMSSYSIAVLGEVKNPGSVPVSREKINIFEALALAGDMTIYGVRDRVRLIREDATGKKEIHVLDLTDANIINSPYYYLQQNDMVYVEPSNIKKQDARVGSMTNLWFSATSILVSLASMIVTILK